MPLPVLKTALMVAGTALSAYGAAREGIDTANNLNAQAAAERRDASDAQATAQREAIQRKREAGIVLGRQQAIAAASGGTATDSTILNLQGNTAAEGDYQAKTALYEGDTKAAGLLDQASIDRSEARQARMAGFIKAGSTMLTGLSGMGGGSGSSSFSNPFAKKKPMFGPPAPQFRYG